MDKLEKPWKSDLQKTFARRVKEVREELGYSQNQLALAARKYVPDFTQGSVSRIEAGKQDPGLQIVSGIAKAMGVPAWFLMTDSDEVEQRVIRTPQPPTNVVHLDRPDYRVFPKSSRSDTKQKGQEKRRGR